FRTPLELVFIALGLAVSASGQETTGAITGVVSDPSGAVVTSAEITVVNAGTNATFKTSTNSSATYVLRTLPVGIYRLTAGAPGFKRYETTDIVTQVNEVTRLDVTMSVGDVSESVEVRAATVNVNTEDASLRTVVDQRRVEDLPLNG